MKKSNSLITISILALFIVLALFYCSDCKEVSESNTAYLIFHASVDFKNENIDSLVSLVDRTNKLSDFLDLDKMPDYEILDVKTYTDNSTYNNEIEIKRNHCDTIHIFFWRSSPNYDPNNNRICLLFGIFESEKILLHELVHHRLDDENRLFPHYYKDKPKCGSSDTAYWCTNLMSLEYIPFGVMLTEEQHSTIQEIELDTIGNYYCNTRHLFPKDQKYLNYQDSIECCTNLNLDKVNYNAIIDEVDDNKYSVADREKFITCLKKLMISLFNKSQKSFCSRVLSDEFIDRLQLLIDNISFDYDADSTIAFSVSFPDNQLNSILYRPDSMDNNTVLLSAVDLHMISLLQNPDIVRFARKEAEIMSTIYNENANKVFYRNMGVYQKDLIIEMSKKYTKDGIPFTLNKTHIESIINNYSDYDRLEIKGINYKGLNLYLSTKDLAYMKTNM